MICQKVYQLQTSENRLDHVLYLVPRVLSVLAHKGRVAVQHLIDDDAETPPVGADIVARTAKHFGRHVVVCADDRKRLLPPLLISPGQNRRRCL